MQIQRRVVKTVCAVFFAFVSMHAFAPQGVSQTMQESQEVVTDVLTLDGVPKFAWNKRHYPHVNPDAPKGGTLRLSARGSFDSLHRFIARGLPAAGLGLTYDTLGTDVPDRSLFEIHGLIAEKFAVAKDRSYITFHINPKARFHDGSPITAEDVAFTFNILMEQGAPSYKQYYASVSGVEVLAPLEVRFTFKDTTNKELPLIMAQLPVLSKAYWQGKDFSKPSFDIPLGNGPYKVHEFSAGSYIELERVKDYWAADLPVNKGRFNFGALRYEYFRDETVSREAFKAGSFDLYMEATAKSWATAYTGRAVENGDIVREEISLNYPQGMYGFFFNTRRPLFEDVRVRRAIGLLFDFEWSNKALFYNQYQRSYSYFTNSELASSGKITPEEEALLRPYADTLPKEIFTEVFSVPKTKGDGTMREEMTEALKLLSAAGWNMQDGVMKNAQGEALEFSFILSSPTLQRTIMPFRNNLKRLGITMNIAVIDQTQYVNRIRSFDFDMILSRIPQGNYPGNEQRNNWTSNAAKTEGTRNYIGVNLPVVDELVERIINAQDRESLITAARALDRVLLWHYYVVPGWYSSTSRIAFWRKLAHNGLRDVEWVDVFSWWIDAKAEAELLASDTGYGK